jgi:hypothetical protein
MTDNRRPRRWRPVMLLLAVPLIAVLVPEFYNFGHPAIGGMPFFYWWQLAWIAGVAVCTGIVYRTTRSPR